MDSKQKTRLQQRCEASKSAQAALELIQESVEGDEQYFWTIIRNAALEKAPLEASGSFQVKPMNDKEATKFEHEVMPYGEFKGKLVREVPLNRLDWLAGTDDKFKEDLRRYLRNERIVDRVKKFLNLEEEDDYE